MFWKKNVDEEPQLPATWQAQDIEALRQAKALLEHPSLTAKVSDLIGQPVEQMIRYLPDTVQQRVQELSHSALMAALQMALRTLPAENTLGTSQTIDLLPTEPSPAQPSPAQTPAPQPPAKRGWRSFNWRSGMIGNLDLRGIDWHKTLGAGAGAIGGAFGLWAMAVELPISTGIMLRAIAATARTQGHDISRLETQLACLEVFALGGRSNSDDAAESGYWLARASVGKTITDAATYLSRYGLTADGAPPVVRLLARLASRFSTDVSAQAVARALPLVSAATAASLNVLFINHYQSVATGHFIVKRLEKVYGQAAVEEKYRALSA
jgi:hypothetical protein